MLHWIRLQDSIFESEHFDLCLLRGREDDRAPDFKAIFDLHIRKHEPGILDEARVQEAPEVVGEDLWIVRELESMAAPCYCEARQSHRLALLLGPVQQLGHVWVPAVEVDDDLPPPKGLSSLAVELRHLAGRCLVLKRRPAELG